MGKTSAVPSPVSAIPANATAAVGANPTRASPAASHAAQAAISAGVGKRSISGLPTSRANRNVAPKTPNATPAPPKWAASKRSTRNALSVP